MKNENVVIVAARLAILDYENYGCYICQSNRSFRANCSYLAFYLHNKISTHVPKILGYIDDISINNPEFNTADLVNISSNMEELSERLNSFLFSVKDNSKWSLNKYKIIILSKFDDPRTIKLKHEILNNKTDKLGRIRVPYTQSQRYSTLVKLNSSHFTTELES